MLLSVRRSAGLKDNFYYNSCPESMKNCMKKDIDNQKKAAGPGKSLKCSCTEFSDIAEKFVGKYCRNAYRAIVGDSPYTPAPSYRQLEISKEEWDQLSKQSESHLWIILVVYPSNRKGITKSLGGVYWTEEMLIATEHNTGYVSS